MWKGAKGLKAYFVSAYVFALYNLLNMQKRIKFLTSQCMQLKRKRLCRSLGKVRSSLTETS